VWARARAYLADARPQTHTASPDDASSRGHLLRILLITAWLPIIAAPLTYLIAGSIPALADVQRTPTGPTAFRAVLAASVLGAAWTT
jgi:hypothetical protein